MARLTKQVQRYIVVELACYESVSNIIEACREQFGLEVSPSQVSYYNPRNLASAKELSQDLRDLFETARAEYQSQVEDVGIAQKRFRLQRLDRYLRKLEDAGNVLGAATLLEQAAKEDGGAYTNKALLELEANSRNAHFVVEVPPALSREEWLKAYAPKAQPPAALPQKTG